jgi:hypothetical protein
MRLAGELILIVVGVLVAFQVESYRAEQDTADRAQAQLRALVIDMRANHERLRNEARGQRRVVESQRAVIRIGNGDDPLVPNDSMAVLITRAGQFFRHEPVTGAYDALVAAGDLRLIDTDSLRTALADFMVDARLGYEDEDLSDLLRTELIGALSESTSFLSVMRPGMRGIADLPESSSPPNVEALLQNQRYMSFLALLAAVESGVLNHLVQLEEEAAAIVRMIEADLAEAF